MYEKDSIMYVDYVATRSTLRYAAAVGCMWERQVESVLLAFVKSHGSIACDGEQIFLLTVTQSMRLFRIYN